MFETKFSNNCLHDNIPQYSATNLHLKNTGSTSPKWMEEQKTFDGQKKWKKDHSNEQI